MCGIWGLFANKKIESGDLTKIVKDLFIYSESRGKEASGIAGVCNGRIVTLKKPIQASKLIKSHEFEALLNDVIENGRERSVLVGHSRLATNGSEYNNKNNQPITIKGLSLVHNGIIVNADELWNSNRELNKTSELDTEILGKIIAGGIESGFAETDAVKNAFAQIQGTASAIVIDENGKWMIAATNNGSLYCVRNAARSMVIFASEAYILEEVYKANSYVRKEFGCLKVKHLEANNGLFLTSDERIHAKVFKLNKYSVLNDNNRKSAKDGLFEKYKGYDIDIERIKRLKRCSRCVLPETFPYIQFDSEGVCNYCRSYTKMRYYGEDKLYEWAEITKRTNYGKEYNSLVSFSGGRDSSYGLHFFVKELGLKPVAYNYDWGMVTDLARRNQARMCAALGIELITVSADIRSKRENIKKNILAWIKKPDLGMIPLFMAGDKAYFYYANIMKKRFGFDSVLLASNPFEATHFKSAFCGIKPSILNSGKNDSTVERLKSADVVKMAAYYANQYSANTKYINSSLIDTALAAISYYVIPHNYFRLYDYIPWEENTINEVLLNEYNWEMASDTDSTWRIGDGTAPFYNFIYYSVCGFTENDTLRSNQIREGHLSRNEAIELVYRDNQPRWESLEWYFNILGLDMADVLSVIAKMRRMY